MAGRRRGGQSIRGFGAGCSGSVGDEGRECLPADSKVAPFCCIPIHCMFATSASVNGVWALVLYAVHRFDTVNVRTRKVKRKEDSRTRTVLQTPRAFHSKMSANVEHENACILKTVCDGLLFADHLSQALSSLLPHQVAGASMLLSSRCWAYGCILISACSYAYR